MSAAVHIPVLRRGKPYRSLEVARIPHYRTQETVAEVSQANLGLVRRDLLAQGAMQRSLADFAVAELMRRSAAAAGHFLDDSLPLGETLQTPEDYVRQTSATTGLPFVMIRRHMRRLHGVLTELPQIVAGLTRGVEPAILDQGVGDMGGHAVSFVPRAQALGVVLPSNSPGVHGLWAPAVALKTALVLKPGGAEPWTPFRLIQAFVRAGIPADAFGYYPTDHGGAAEILRSCGRGMVFGDASTTKRWARDPRVEIHGPGYSKVVLGPDAAPAWPSLLDVMVTSILENSGRSCINASGVWVTANADAIASALADRLAAVGPREADDPEAQLAPFADPRVAARISASIDEGLAQGGAVDLTQALRGSPRLVEWQGSTYLLPTIVRCDSPEHPLANREFLFPFASVVEVAAEALPEVLGPSLAVTAVTSDAALVRRLLASPLLQRLNLGAMPTQRVSWDQPHEGNLFEHLYQRRAFQRGA